jgi:4-carboxymuconolactone decarboxylase
MFIPGDGAGIPILSNHMGGAMPTLEERFQEGIEMRTRLGGGEGRVFRGSVPAAYELAPDLYRIATECLYGSIWNRPALSMKHRAVATLSAVVVLRSEAQIRAHLRTALNVGLTPQEIVEILMQCTFYAGISSGYNALLVAKEVFEEENIDFIGESTYDNTITPEELYERGLAKHRELNPDVFGYYTVAPTSEEHDLDLLMNEYLWGAIWTRPGLDMKSRIFCALSVQVGEGRYDQWVRRTIEGGLRNGVTRGEVLELFMHLAFFVGILAARSAMNIANTVFRSPEFSEEGSPNL